MRRLEPLRPEVHAPVSATPAPAWSEQALVFEGSQGPIVGVLARPVTDFRTAILIIADQPQTRVGAHRMFTELARDLASDGVASLRFDVGGWGDSPGAPLSFERADADIVAVATGLRELLPRKTQLWLLGLCDGASAAVLALPALRTAGFVPQALCLVNPWVRSDAGIARAVARPSYLRRLMQRAFWTHQLPGGATTEAIPSKERRSSALTSDPKQSIDLPAQLLTQLSTFRGEIYTVLSGKDRIAGETDALMSRDKRWRKRLDRRNRLLRVPDADHTFSNPNHWQSVARWVAARAKG